MEKIIKENIKRYFNKRAIVFSAVYFSLSIIMLFCCNNGKNIFWTVIAGIMLCLLVATQIYYYSIDKSIDKGDCLFIARKVCRVNKINERNKYDSLNTILRGYEVKELKMLQVKLIVSKEKDKRYGFPNALPIYISCIAIFVALVPIDAEPEKKISFAVNMMLLVFFIMITYIVLPLIYYNTDDYILFCIEKILENENKVDLSQVSQENSYNNKL